MGSPFADSSASTHWASLQRAMARTSSSSSAPEWRTTVILFWVRVPVLSEQITWVQPRVSTAVSLRMMADSRLILVTPMDSTMVTTATRPSGMAATASETATMKVSMTRRGSAMNSAPCLMKSTMKMKMQMPMTPIVRMRESSASFRWSGVCSSTASLMESAILPISVSMPVAATTARPRP